MSNEVALRLLSSTLRLNILMNLSKGPKRLGELKEELNVRDTTILHALNISNL